MKLPLLVVMVTSGLVCGCPRNSREMKSRSGTNLAGGASAVAERASVEPPDPDLSAVELSQAAQVRAVRDEVRAQPGSADAWGRLGQACEAVDFLAEAQLCYTRAVQRAPDSARWLHLLGLRELALQPNRVFTKAELLHLVWGYPPLLHTRTLDTHASRLRRKLQQAGAPASVQNVWGVGYRLAETAARPQAA